MSNSIICDIKIAEKIDHHRRKHYGSLFGRIYDRKNSSPRECMLEQDRTSSFLMSVKTRWKNIKHPRGLLHEWNLSFYFDQVMKASASYMSVLHAMY